MLDAFLAALSGRRMFITYRLEPKAGGGTNKIPIDPKTGANIDAQDSRNWLTPDEAQATGLPIGIVIYEGCGLFCVDLDHAIVDGAYTPFALEVMARFPDAAKEISASGSGGHIFATCQTIPAHRTRRAGIPLEVYTRARFIALTGTGMVGNVLVDYTAALHQLIADYYPDAVADASPEWTDEPYEGWRGGGTDEQILANLCNKQSPRALFGSSAPFAALWDADADTLGQFFPPEQPGQGYNASAADQALTNHLAYATGYNCAHVLRLMTEYDCALKRDKWAREDYLHRTILRACEKRHAAELSARPLPPVPLAVPAPPVLQSTPTPPVVDDRTTQPVTVPAGNVEDAPITFANKAPGAYITIGEQQILFADMIHVDDINEINSLDGTMRDQSRFNNQFGHYHFLIDPDGKQTDKAWDAFLYSKLYKFARVSGLTFDPRKSAREIIVRDGLRLLNSYLPVEVPAIEGDITPFLTQLWKMYPYGRDAETVLCYFAAMVQYKGSKFPWAILLQGVEGNGKTFFSTVMEYCMSHRYTHSAKASQLDSRFNSAFEGKLLIVVEDVHITEGRASAWETLKPMITNTRMEIEGKGVDKVTRDVCFNFIMNSNHKDAIRKTINDRRIANFFGAQQHKADLLRDGMTPEYFKRLYDWAREEGGFAAIHHYLQNFPIPDELNPATACNRAPETTSTTAAIELSRGSVEQELSEAIAGGRRGFLNGWISSVAFDQLLADLDMTRRITRHRRHELILEHGYILHPDLPDGRVLTTLSDGSRPRLYVVPGHSSIGHTLSGKVIADAFTTAQAPQ